MKKFNPDARSWAPDPGSGKDIKKGGAGQRPAKRRRNAGGVPFFREYIFTIMRVKIGKTPVKVSFKVYDY